MSNNFSSEAFIKSDIDKISFSLKGLIDLAGIFSNSERGVFCSVCFCSYSFLPNASILYPVTFDAKLTFTPRLPIAISRSSSSKIAIQ